MNRAPSIGGVPGGARRGLAGEKADVIRGWTPERRMRRGAPCRLIFAIWTTTRR